MKLHSYGEDTYIPNSGMAAVKQFSERSIETILPDSPQKVQDELRSSPAGWLTFVLFVQPLLQWRKIIQNCGGIHLLLTCKSLKGFLPRTAATHLEHRIQTAPRLLILVDRTAIQRLLALRDLR